MLKVISGWVISGWGDIGLLCYQAGWRYQAWVKSGLVVVISGWGDIRFGGCDIRLG